ncbi:Lacal_2735 family protein [Sunxiuqinia sp. sy24]|uniref:Lacal_2735 family protein n=1 Tax=Sunxiuqinia sp. sy24 TaxID=3461495 RepID=UPI0040464508
MFGLFRRKSEVEKLQLKYNKLMQKYYELSKVNRREAEKYYVEAEDLLKQINSMLKTD